MAGGRGKRGRKPKQDVNPNGEEFLMAGGRCKRGRKPTQDSNPNGEEARPASGRPKRGRKPMQDSNPNGEEALLAGGRRKRGRKPMQDSNPSGEEPLTAGGRCKRGRKPMQHSNLNGEEALPGVGRCKRGRKPMQDNRNPNGEEALTTGGRCKRGRKTVQYSNPNEEKDGGGRKRGRKTMQASNPNGEEALMAGGRHEQGRKTMEDSNPNGEEPVMASGRRKRGRKTMQVNNPNRSDERKKEVVDPDTLIPYIGWDNSINCLLRCSRSDYGAIAALNRNFCHLIRSGELYQLRRRAGIVEHWIYFSVNLLKWEAYDPVRMRWISQLPKMEASTCFVYSDKESLAVGTQLLVFGREVSCHVVYRYSHLTNTWCLGLPMNTPRCLFASGSIGAIGIVAGGCNSTGKVLSVAELYNSETDEWIPLPDMNIPRKMCSGVFMDGKFYIVGGVDDESNPFTCGEVFDLETQTWEVIPNMYPRPAGEEEGQLRRAIEAPPLLGVINNELYCADHTTQEIRKYDKKKNSWTAIGRLPERAASVRGWGLAFRACGERLMVLGGPREFGTGVLELYSWIPSQGPVEWELLASKRIGSFVYNCAVMGC
ncbi:hypothetical protein CDL15_Pgr008907 [Punica granatum]|nr:hypothetical protein CDL15_Pgr008907 [Punica granatum]